jgi:hypothetical protein
MNDNDRDEQGTKDKEVDFFGTLKALWNMPSPPSQRIEWELVVAKVPAEAAEFEAALKASRRSPGYFCRWHEGYEKGSIKRISAAWERFKSQFSAATGLTLFPYCYYRDEYDEDPKTGWEIDGAWELSAAGKTFFKKEDEQSIAPTEDHGLSA